MCIRDRNRLTGCQNDTLNAVASGLQACHLSGDEVCAERDRLLPVPLHDSVRVDAAVETTERAPDDVFAGVRWVRVGDLVVGHPLDVAPEGLLQGESVFRSLSAVLIDEEQV